MLLFYSFLQPPAHFCSWSHGPSLWVSNTSFFFFFFYTAPQTPKINLRADCNFRCVKIFGFGVGAGIWSRLALYSRSSSARRLGGSHVCTSWKGRTRTNKTFFTGLVCIEWYKYSICTVVLIYYGLNVFLSTSSAARRDQDSTLSLLQREPLIHMASPSLQLT